MPSSRLSFRLHLFPSASTCFLHSHLLEHDALGVRCPGERLLPLGAEVRLLVVLVGPELRAAVRLELAPGSETARLAAIEFFLEVDGSGVFGGERVGFFVCERVSFERCDRCGCDVVERRGKEGREGGESEEAKHHRSTAAQSGGGGRRSRRKRRCFRSLAYSTRTLEPTARRRTA